MKIKKIIIMKVKEKDYVNQKLNYKKTLEEKRLKKFMYLINEIKVLIIIKKRLLKVLQMQVV